MKTSNKILLGTLTLVMIMLLISVISFKPEYLNTTIRNISDSFSIVSIECENMKSEQIHFSKASDKENTYIYWMKGKQMKTSFVNLYENQDTLFVKSVEIDGERLHLHLKDVKEIFLNREKINIDNIGK